MNHDSVEFTTLKKVTATILGMDVNEIEPEMNFFTDLGADSLDAMELSLAIEENLGVSITDEQMAEIKTVGDIVKILGE